MGVVHSRHAFKQEKERGMKAVRKIQAGIVVVVALAASVLLTGYATVSQSSPVRVVDDVVDEITATAPALTTIKVNATKEIAVVPDKARITVAVTTQAATTEEAQAQNAQNVNAVLDALAGLGVQDRSIQTTDTWLSPIYDYSSSYSYTTDVVEPEAMIDMPIDEGVAADDEESPDLLSLLEGATREKTTDAETDTNATDAATAREGASSTDKDADAGSSSDKDSSRDAESASSADKDSTSSTDKDADQGREAAQEPVAEEPAAAEEPIPAEEPAVDTDSNIAGYEMTTRLAVSDLAVEDVAAVLQAAIAAGANSTDGIQYYSSDYDTVYAEALAGAVDVANDKAGVISKAAGMELVGITDIEEGYQNAAYRYDAAMAMGVAEEDAATMKINPGEVNISATITVTYEAKAK